jgi:hypothetical protein
LLFPHFIDESKVGFNVSEIRAQHSVQGVAFIRHYESQDQAAIERAFAQILTRVLHIPALEPIEVYRNGIAVKTNIRGLVILESTPHKISCQVWVGKDPRKRLVAAIVHIIESALQSSRVRLSAQRKRPERVGRSMDHLSSLPSVEATSTQNQSGISNRMHSSSSVTFAAPDLPGRAV